MFKRLLSLPKKAGGFLAETQNINLIRDSGLFDEAWYLSRNPDVAEAKADPVRHYLRYGCLEGRDPNLNFSSTFYLDTYADVKNAGINPLIHYLKYGKAEGRSIRSKFKCPVCSKEINGFLPVGSDYQETRIKFGYPYSFNDHETINPNQFTCPSCGATDRDRLYALYIAKELDINSFPNGFALLDIAPSLALQAFLLKFANIKYQSADKYMKGVDLVIDITDMNQVPSGSCDIFICSHVLEHVTDDRKALSELFRILKPGGFGILMVPIVLKIEQIDEDPTIIDVETRWRRFGQYDHVRLYSKNGFIGRVEEAGFILKQYGAEHFGAEVFAECGISPRSVLYVVLKHAN